MRIENPTNRNNSNVFQKKDKSKKEEKKQKTSIRHSDHLDLSAAIVLLTHLLDAPEHQYKPLPFYFSDAAAKNAKLVSKISTSIQHKARLQDIDLNYDMISDLVISHANETDGLAQTMTYQHIPLKKSESDFFEHLHITGLKLGLTGNVISAVVRAYSDYVRHHKQHVSTQKKQIHLLLETINNSDDFQVSNNKNLLISLLETFMAEGQT